MALSVGSGGLKRTKPIVIWTKPYLFLVEYEQNQANSERIEFFPGFALTEPPTRNTVMRCLLRKHVPHLIEIAAGTASRGGLFFGRRRFRSIGQEPTNDEEPHDS